MRRGRTQNAILLLQREHFEASSLANHVQGVASTFNDRLSRQEEDMQIKANLIDAVRNRQAVLFAGAGISWKGLPE